jgi:hypothetical protein
MAQGDSDHRQYRRAMHKAANAAVGVLRSPSRNFPQVIVDNNGNLKMRGVLRNSSNQVIQ